MSDSYQAIYDAVRSRISNGDVGDAVSRAASSAFDISNVVCRMIESQYIVRDEMTRASVLFRPALFQDGTQWCAMYGENLQEGVAGFGDTPEKAMLAFDAAWAKQDATKPAFHKRHTHVNSGIAGDDSCKTCGADLRNEIHLRAGEKP